MEIYSQYQPLKWPPVMQLAQLHLKCSGPGKDNTQGLQCPCCGRYEKIKTTNWRSRDIKKDFKSYGGGIPAYFDLLKYAGFTFFCLSLIIVIYHIYILEQVCSDPQAQCVSLFVIFKFCNSSSIYDILVEQGSIALADAYFYLQLGSYLFLILATIGMKIWLNYVNSKKIIKENKVYSQFSLMFKNIPEFYQVEDLKKQILEEVPNAEICEIFYLHKLAEYQIKYKKLFDLYYNIKFIEDSINEERGGSEQQLKELIAEYVHLYIEVDELEQKTRKNNGRAIVVFNKIDQKEEVYKKFRIGECSKLVFHVGKLFKMNTKKLHFFADKVAQPQEIIWKYVGESSVTKTKVRIQTTLIVFAFMIVSFALLYFPILEVDQQKVEHPSIGTALNIIISLALIILSVAYRMIILRLMPRRHPSSRQSQAYFIVINTVIFHFLFYVIVPASYYLIADQIPKNAKLAQLFFAVVLFICMNILVAFIDIRYRIFRGRRNKLMSSWANWGKFCQIRLHEELKYPSFPIQFKYMVILNIWSFNAFYIFQIPYLLVLFWSAVLILYWVDKKNIYTHYKMQVFLSIEMELSVQRDYIFFFLICVSLGYAIAAVYTWQYYFIGIIFLLSMVANLLISLRKSNIPTQLQRSMTLAEVIRNESANPKQSMIHQIMDVQNKDNIMVLDSDFSSKSIGSVSFQYGYREQYNSYLSQFKNKNVNDVLEKAYIQFTKTHSQAKSKRQFSKQSQMEQFSKKNSTKMSPKNEANDSKVEI